MQSIIGLMTSSAADKWGPTLTGGKFGYNVSIQACKTRVEASLKRLGVDFIGEHYRPQFLLALPACC